MSKNKLIVKNTIFLATRTLFSLLIAFYTTRVILHQLGVSDYGLFSVIYGTVAFFVFIVSAMNDSVQRFISINLGNNDYIAVSNTIKNSVLIYFLGGMIFCLLLLLIRDYVVEHLLTIDVNALAVAKKIYVIALLSIFISIIQTPFNAIVLAHEKMSFYAYMTIFDSLSKLIVSFSLIAIPYNKLIVYSLLLLLSALTSFSIYVYYCFKSFPLSLKGGVLSRKIIKDITMFSFWNTFGNFAYVCRTQGINIAINVFFATTVNAAYALSSTILNAINSLTQSLVSAIRPQIFKSYAENNEQRYLTLVTYCSKYTFSFLFLVSCPVLICTKELLSLWLVSIPPYTIGFVRLVIVVALIDSFSSSIIAGVQAVGKIKVYQLTVSFFVFISLPFSYLLFKLGFPPFSAYIPLIITAVINLFLRSYFLARYTSFDFIGFVFKIVLPCVFSAVATYAVSYYINGVISPEGIFSILLTCFFYSFIYLMFALVFVVSNVEKKIVLSVLTSKFHTLRERK
ncbi:TPA: oligosaccharide flippase family protein [Raoultella ornithinolytica]|jgi:O-antigen/teichoic acid export membrane protein|uniref:oligosaccharide flippase family protein n=1 Tax=Raoultella ornithinolytica TaxID=54291 RepID=UPI00194F8EA9|nr:oligosaccharide flippase family protein [Raoultella ornithinolytica]MBM6477175.1 oligosaccharide flippase family protein [Raoultella ornithinolytica]MCF6707583.1 oligosaccharide flippase family protein [Raoultella ornithinolytica]HAT1603424.1 oligosaccharide flippase family protein [Raoultella ornithinolytica]HDS8978402.1 oligosaccharide flippase family protein [Raoultella ornithinolytica]HDT1250550.1 oligosaccharide flippase family protein [Raoultella ornithinolytica]